MGGVAQRLEQRAHNLLVAGSIPATPTKSVMLEPPADGRRFLVLSGVVTPPLQAQPFPEVSW